MNKVLIFLYLIFNFSTVFSAEVRTLGRSPKALLMGDAYTSLAEHEYTLFYNPAILARHKGFSFASINPTLSGINIVDELDKFEDIGDDPIDVYSEFAGTPVYLGLNAAPGFKMGRFAMSAIINHQTSFTLKNSISPTLDLDHRYDRGFIAGYGFSLNKNVSVGLSTKYIQRESIDNSFYLFGTSLLDALSQGDIDDIISELGKVNGSGWGFDLGFDYYKKSGSQTFTAGLAILDLYTVLHTESNPDDLEVQAQPMQVNLGGSWQGAVGNGFNLTVSADIRNLEQQMDFMRRLHLGVELGISPVISLLAGLNAQDNYSYGLKLHLGFLEVYAGFYGTEIGENLDQEESNRFLLSLNLFSFGFEP